MSSSNITNLQMEAAYLNYVATMFVRCYCFAAVPLSGVGHALSIYVFTCSSLRSNSCVMYFLAATVFGVLNTCFSLPMRLVQSGLINADPGAHSIVGCKMAWYLLNVIRFSAFWMIVLASADRYLCSSTSANQRAWSNTRTARRIILMIVFIGCIIHIHILVFFNIGIIPSTQQPFCYPTGPPGTYRIVFSYFILFAFGLTPALCMLLFGVFTFLNIQRSKRLLVRPKTNVQILNQQNNRKTNRQILRMLAIQVLVYGGTGLIYSIAWIVTAMKSSQTNSFVQVAQENLLNAVVGMLSNLGPNSSFYLFTLSSSLFRKEVKNLFKKSFRFCNQPHIDDLTRTHHAMTALH